MTFLWRRILNSTSSRVPSLTLTLTGVLTLTSLAPSVTLVESVAGGTAGSSEPPPPTTLPPSPPEADSELPLLSQPASAADTTSAAAAAPTRDLRRDMDDSLRAGVALSPNT